MSGKYSSEEIIKGLLSFDIKVYQYLDKIYCPKVIAHVRKNSGTYEDGEELYMDIIYKVYINIEQKKYDPKRGTFGAYFMGIAYRSWLNELHKRKKSIDTISMDVPEYISDHGETTQEEQDDYYRDVQKLLRCINNLPKDQQDMIHLFYFARKSLDFITQKMNIKSYSYTRTKMHRIRNKLRTMMEDPDFDSDPELAPI